MSSEIEQLPVDSDAEGVQSDSGDDSDDDEVHHNTWSPQRTHLARAHEHMRCCERSPAPVICLLAHVAPVNYPCTTLTMAVQTQEKSQYLLRQEELAATAAALLDELDAEGLDSDTEPEPAGKKVSHPVWWCENLRATRLVLVALVQYDERVVGGRARSTRANGKRNSINF